MFTKRSKSAAQKPTSTDVSSDSLDMSTMIEQFESKPIVPVDSFTQTESSQTSSQPTALQKKRAINIFFCPT